ncbi:hypothetical protein NLU13_9611 [Sarocladium strictum]|uniref:Amidase domain-containing protein n=1 Tax=Sarocladium strictum TaxID=5046 RepID=A0AA39GAG6_SARSR|nr:hypothetical protein NLU13_9611 [Sarocladium strictum]
MHLGSLLVLAAHGAASSTFGTYRPPSFTPGPGFDVREATIDSIHDSLYKGEVTCRDVVSAFLARIEEFNPLISAVLSLNPAVLADADLLDADDAPWSEKGRLHCIPILLKDNYDAVGMPTTAGCKALAHLEPTSDAPVVTALKSAGAIILGKVNMHEMALEGLSVSSLGGQTLNPYDLSRTPGGSSGGSGAAIAANLAVVATGTDTVNSLRSPASANNLFSFRPTRGLISRAGVIPVGYTQDALGAMGRSVKDIATVLDVMAKSAHHPADNATALKPPNIHLKDYDTNLFGGTLAGMRIGVLSGAYNHTASSETSPVLEAMANMERLLRDEGVELSPIVSPMFNMADMASEVDVQSFEYREVLNEYLQREDLKGEPRPASFEELRSTSDPAYLAKKKRIEELTTALHEEFRSKGLDAIIYPEQRNLVVKVGSPSQAGRNGILAAVTGSPVVVVPAGWSEPSEDAPLGVPIGMEILGMPWTEEKLLRIAQLISQETGQLRKPPKLAEHAVRGKCYSHVPSGFLSTVADASQHYPMGILDRQ